MSNKRRSNKQKLDKGANRSAIVEVPLEKSLTKADELRDFRNTLGVVNATFVKAAKADPKLGGKPESEGLPNPTGETADGTGIIDPPYDLETLSKFRENNSAITPMVDAYKTNIAGFGWELRYNIDIHSKDIDDSIKEAAKKEWVTLENFYKYCNFDSSFSSILQRMIDDREYMGTGYLEVIQNAKGLPAGFEYIPAHTINITKNGDDPQVVTLQVVDAMGKTTKIAFQKRFRRFRQQVESTTIWFKEFGDPRRMDRLTGEYETSLEGDQEQTHEILPENEASALLMFSIPVPYSVYGLPRWLGNLIGMQGSRKSEELNYRYFTHGRHTPLAIIVNNGSLTDSSMDVLKGYVSTVEGSDNAFGYLVLEASGFDDDDPNSENPTKASIEVKPLIDAIQNDGLFQEYDKNSRDKLRESMRLAPIYTGASKDYTRATADVARAITEEQVFQPERKMIADRISRLVNQALGIKYVEMVLSGPDITNKKDLADAIAVYSKTGSITPNMLTEAVSALLGQNFEPVEDSWGDLPISIVLELIKKGKLEVALTEADNTDPSFTDESLDDGGKKDE